MNSPLRKPMLSFAVLSIIFISCQPNQIKEGTKDVAADQTEKILTPEEQEIIAAVEKLLFAAGNYNIHDLDEMTSDKAMIGVSSLKDGVWSNSEITIDEYFESVRNREPRPYCEIPTDYDIIVTEGRLALVRADAILHRNGIPQTREINHFTMMKEDVNWTFLNISFTVDQVAEKDRKFDLDIFARSYAQAWGSTRPEFVALYFAENGSLQVNDGDPAVGREAIANVAMGFMTDLADMIVRFDSLVPKFNGTEFHWTLIATNSGPGGTGNKVEVSGYELWQLDESGLIQKSLGSFPTTEYNRQLKIGVDH
jgi:hypothetical protein